METSGDTGSKPGWGIVLGGEPFDLEHWKESLRQPFDPWVTKVIASLVLRSERLNSATTSTEAIDLGVAPMAQINGALSARSIAGMIRAEGIIKFLPDGRHQRFVPAVMRATDARDRVSMTLIARGPDGKPLPSPPPERSAAQQWLSIAADDELLADTLTFFGRSDNWFDAYKALECLIARFGGGKVEKFLALGWESKSKIELLKRTADFWRHSPRGRPKVDRPPNPMELAEARDLLTKLITVAFQRVAAAKGGP
jgi:hypothetical protein